MGLGQRISTCFFLFILVVGLGVPNPGFFGTAYAASDNVTNSDEPLVGEQELDAPCSPNELGKNEEDLEDGLGDEGVVDDSRGAKNAEVAEPKSFEHVVVPDEAYSVPVPLPESSRVVEDGVYTISSALDHDKVLDIAGASDANGAAVDAWSNAYFSHQKFRVTYVDGYYQIESMKSGKLLDVAGGASEEGTVVDQWESNGGDNQKWIIVSNPDGSFSIVSKCNGLYLDLSGGSVFDGVQAVVWQQNGGLNQSFSFSSAQTLADGVYEISSSINGDIVLDVAWASYDNGARIDGWTSAKRQWQKFQITYHDGYYSIASVNSGKNLDVEGGSWSNGTHVVQWDKSGESNQLWSLLSNGDGSYTLVSKANALALDLEGGVAVDGVNAIVWERTGAPNQSFRFSETPIVEDGVYSIGVALNSSKCLDVFDRSFESGSPVGVWDNGKSSNQKFSFSYGGNGCYSIAAVHSMMFVGVQDRSQGSAIVQYGDDSSPATRWRIEPAGNGSYKIVSDYSGMCIDIPWANASNGVKADAWGDNGGSNQRFILSECQVLESGCYYIQSFMDQSLVLDVPNDSQDDLAQISLWSIGNGQKPWQKFNVEYIDDEYFTVQSVSSRKFLDVEGGGVATPGCRVIQYGYNGGSNQQWCAVPKGGDSYAFISKSSGLVLDVVDSVCANGALLDVWEPNGQANQRFSLKPASVSSSYIPLGMTLDQMTQWQFDGNPYIQDYDWWFLRNQLNPQSFSAGSDEYYQFADLRVCTGLSSQQIDAYIRTNGVGGQLDGMGYAFVQAAQYYGLNEAYFVCHTVLESGWGKSTLASGYYYDGVSDIWDNQGSRLIEGGKYPAGYYYNFFGIGAFDYDPITCGRAAAIRNGWSSKENAVYGAAQWIASNYVYNTSYIQPTLYDMKWDTNRSSSSQKYGWHQYATDPGWATKIARLMASCYSLNGAIPEITYRIPQYL